MGKVAIDDRDIDWNMWNTNINTIIELLKPFPKGIMPPTQDTRFKKAVYELVQMLSQETRLPQYLSILVFLKEHPMINLVLLRYAVTGAVFKGTLTARTIVWPYDVNMILWLTFDFYNLPF